MILCYPACRMLVEHSHFILVVVPLAVPVRIRKLAGLAGFLLPTSFFCLGLAISPLREQLLKLCGYSRHGGHLQFTAVSKPKQMQVWHLLPFSAHSDWVHKAFLVTCTCKKYMYIYFYSFFLCVYVVQFL